MRSCLIVVIFVAAFVSNTMANAQERQEVLLWPAGMPEPKVSTDPPEKLEKAGKDGITRRFNVSKPRLVVYEAPAKLRTGAAAIVVPGGGLGILADEHEGSEACQWLNTLGITSFLLLHRCPTNKQTDPYLGPTQDAQMAVRVVREKAKTWNLDDKKIGVLAFSAGGQVALTAATNSVKFPDNHNELPPSHKPDFLLVSYPYQIYDAKAKTLKSTIRVDQGLCPTFISQCADDAGSLAQGSTLLFLELVNRKIPAELHIYEKGGHGYGLRARPNATGPTDWTSRAADWLRLRGLAHVEKNIP